MPFSALIRSFFIPTYSRLLLEIANTAARLWGLVTYSDRKDIQSHSLTDFLFSFVGAQRGFQVHVLGLLACKSAISPTHVKSSCPEGGCVYFQLFITSSSFLTGSSMLTATFLFILSPEGRSLLQTLCPISF